MEYPARHNYVHLQSLERSGLAADLILTYRIIFGLVDVCMIIFSWYLHMATVP